MRMRSAPRSETIWIIGSAAHDGREAAVEHIDILGHDRIPFWAVRRLGGQAGGRLVGWSNTTGLTDAPHNRPTDYCGLFAAWTTVQADARTRITPTRLPAIIRSEP